MKHTPGPWKLIEGDDDGDVIVVMDVAHTVLIGNLEDTCPTCHANARLIAAAPDLLVVCHNALGAYEAIKDAGLDKYLPGYEICLQDLKSAIAKAEGKS